MVVVVVAIVVVVVAMVVVMVATLITMVVIATVLAMEYSNEQLGYVSKHLLITSLCDFYVFDICTMIDGDPISYRWSAAKYVATDLIIV